MKKIAISIIFLIFSLNAFCQWIPLTTGVTSDLNNIQFTDQNNGYCVGNNGIFLKTVDGGTTWSLKTFFTAETFLSVHFINASIGFICSDNHIYRTIDGGATFVEITNVLQHPLMPSLPMTEIKMSFKDTIGIITASWNGDTTISYKTENAGNSWQPLLLPPMAFYNSVDYSIVTNDIIYAVRSNQQYKTINSGASWVNIRALPFGITGDNAFRIFDSSGIGYASCGYGTAFVKFYNDFTDTAIDNETISDPHSFSFINADTGYFLKIDKLYKTNNRGLTNEIIYTLNATDSRKWHVFFLNNSIGFLCGENGIILKTTNGGSTSINNPTLKKKLKLYPNPANEKLNLEYDSDIEIQSLYLMDMSGKIIRKYLSDSKSLNVSNIAAGSYLLYIKTEKGELTEKIGIQ